MLESGNKIYHTINKDDLRDAISWLNTQHIFIQSFYWENEDVIEKAELEALDTQELVSEVILRWASSYQDLEIDRMEKEDNMCYDQFQGETHGY